MATSKPSSSLLRQILRPSYTTVTVNTLHPHQQHRALHASIKTKPIPKPTPFVPDVQTFLTLIGRDMSAHASKFESWQKLFTTTSVQMKDLGIEPPRSRRYLLRWRQKFRDGEYGVGGDFQYVKDGKAELRVVEVPRIKEAVARETSVNSPMPGMVKLVVNVPPGTEESENLPRSLLREGEDTSQLQKPRGYKLVDGRTIVGPYIEIVKGSNGAVGVVSVKEGMWEDRRGQKVDGGERRRAEVRHKKGVAEHRKNR